MARHTFDLWQIPVREVIDSETNIITHLIGSCVRLYVYVYIHLICIGLLCKIGKDRDKWTGEEEQPAQLAPFVSYPLLYALAFSIFQH